MGWSEPDSQESTKGRERQPHTVRASLDVSEPQFPSVPSCTSEPVRKRTYKVPTGLGYKPGVFPRSETQTYREGTEGTKDHERQPRVMRAPSSRSASHES